MGLLLCVPLTKVCSFGGQVPFILQSSKLWGQKHNVSLLVGYWKWWYMGSLLLPPLGFCIHIFFPLGAMVPYTGLWFSILSLSWRTVPCRELLLSWCFSCTFSKLIPSLFPGQLLFDGVEYDMLRESYGHRHTPTLSLLWSKSPGQML